MYPVLLANELEDSLLFANFVLMQHHVVVPEVIEFELLESRNNFSLQCRL